MREITNINKEWSFFKNTDDINIKCGGETVNLPHTWNAVDGQDGGNDYFRGKCVYKKNVNRRNLPSLDKHYIEIEGANSSAEVFVNGRSITRHDGGYSTFRAEIEDKSDEFEIAIVVENSTNEEVYPQMADFTFYGGLYRSVNIISVPESHFKLDYYGGPGIKVTATVEDGNADIEIEVFVSNIKSGDEISYEIYDKIGTRIAKTTLSSSVAKFRIENAHLWNGRSDPYLYRASAILERNGKAIDCVSQNFGCRSFRVDTNGGFVLNGNRYCLRGVSRHQDWKGIGNALLPEHHERDMELILELGATTVRLAHYQHSQYFYDLCDREGIVVWAEIPYISNHLEKGNENAENQLRELVIQNYNHPSIMFWGLSNEITMTGSTVEIFEEHKRLNDLAHELDKTRLTTVACVSMCDIDEPYVHITDLVAYNHYFGWYGGSTDMNGPWFDNFHSKYPNKPIGISEYGCEALDYHSAKPEQGDYTEEYQAYYHEELIKQLFTRNYIWAAYVWNMFDFGADARCEGGEHGMNHKGLVTMDRKYKKDAFYAYKAWLSDEPFVHIAGKRFVDRVEDTTRVTIYSNQEEVELFVNGVSLGKQSSRNHFFYYEVKNVGESELLAKSGSLTDKAHIRRVSEPNEKYILKERGTVLNWFDVEAPDGRFSLNDKISDIIKCEKGKHWFTNLREKIEKAVKSSGKATKAAGFELGEGVMKMLEGFTVLRFTGLLSMMDVTFDKEELIRLNKELNEIEK